MATFVGQFAGHVGSLAVRSTFPILRPIVGQFRDFWTGESQTIPFVTEHIAVQLKKLEWREFARTRELSRLFPSNLSRNDRGGMFGGLMSGDAVKAPEPEIFVAARNYVSNLIRPMLRERFATAGLSLFDPDLSCTQIGRRLLRLMRAPSWA